jgi:hypothetical protein
MTINGLSKIVNRELYNKDYRIYTCTKWVPNGDQSITFHINEQFNGIYCNIFKIQLTPHSKDDIRLTCRSEEYIGSKVINVTLDDISSIEKFSQTVMILITQYIDLR